MTNSPADQKDLRAYIRPVLRRWWLIVAIVPLVTIGAYLYYDAKPKVYSASTELFVQPSTLNQLLLGSGGADEANIENLSILLQTSAVAEQAAKVMAKEKGKPPVSGSIAALPLEKSSFLIVTATASTPSGAARLANAYATAFVDIQSRQLRSEASRTAAAAEKQIDRLSADSAQREALEEKLQTLHLVAAQPAGSGGIKQVEPAVAPLQPTDHDPMSKAIFAFVVSLTLAVGAAFGLEYLNRKLTSVEDVEDVYSLPVLTEVPDVDAPAPSSENGQTIAKAFHEPFHRLQMNLDMLSRERPLRTILVASAAPGEGKSIVARNLALAYREAGRNVAVLDADFRKATLGGMLAAQSGPGLAEILSGRATFGQVVQEVPLPETSTNGNSEGQVLTRAASPYGHGGSGELAMVPAGQHHANLSNALASGEMGETLKIAADTYGTAIIDSPPLLAVADVLPLLSEADGVLLVTRLGVSTRDAAHRLLAEFKRIPNIHVVGVVVNGIPSRIYRTRAYGYYYG